MRSVKVQLGMLALAIAYVLLGASCKEAVQPEKPVPQESPAVAAKEMAKRLYPDLRTKGSLLHTAFVERYEHQKRTNPRVLADPDWPLVLADKAAKPLRISPVDLNATPRPNTPVPKATPYVNSLSRGAYDQRQSMPRRRVYDRQYRDGDASEY